MLNIRTFDARQGGNVLYKALAHPLAAEAMARLATRLEEAGRIAIFDPEGTAEALYALHPGLPAAESVFVQDVREVGQPRLGLAARPLTDLPRVEARTVLIAAFDAARIAARIAPLLPAGAEALTLDEARLPPTLLTNPRRYLDMLNFATNFAFFREADGLSTRLVTANYWAGYGAKQVRLWLRLFDGDGRAMASWEQEAPSGAGGIVIDSREVRARFGLPEFTGQLFLHVVGAAGHDVVKYALDTFAVAGGSLSCTHDANAWPSERYAGLPAPREDERVILWVQNSHAAAIPAGDIVLDRMGAEAPQPLDHAIPAFASVGLDVATVLPGLRWPAQIELRCGRHVVRPRYEVVRDGRTRIAHMNVERADLQPDPGIPSLGNLLGRGYLLPFPVLPRDRFRTIVQPTPMALTQRTLPIRLDVFDPEGRRVAERFLGQLDRAHDLALDFDELEAEGGHAELVYDFRDGGEADGWLHALIRYEDRRSGHTAETSFGAHIFNTPMTYRDEPQSYAGPPPGLSTRLFLRIGDDTRHSFTHLTYPASTGAWSPRHARSQTMLVLHDGDGHPIAEHSLSIACSGSALVFSRDLFGDTRMAQAGPRGYVMIRDTTCRLFGYHGLMDEQGGFSLDHMFGF